jgi:hypothetical protein
MEYQPLDFTSFEFRLLTLLNDEAETHDSIIRCSLAHNHLIEPPEYRALSYCWGDPTITKPVIVNGHTMEVTTNLEAALRELKARGFNVMWVDALCINQKDTVERGLQVTRMSLIYSRAHEVVAWLGVEADDSATAIHALREGHIYRSQHSSSFSPRRSSESISRLPVPIKIPFLKIFRKRNAPANSRASPSRMISDSSSHLSSESDLYAENDEPVRDLFRRPFWRRVWIIQEISKARDVQVLCGNQMLSWKKFEFSFDLLAEVPQEIVALRQFRKKERSGAKPNLMTALNRSRYFESSDTRDKIYGVLGLTSDGADIVPMPNYVQAPSIVFFRVFEELVSRTKDFGYLTRNAPRFNVSATETSADWMNYEEGVPAWIFSILKVEATPRMWLLDSDFQKEIGERGAGWPRKDSRGYRSLVRYKQMAPRRDEEIGKARPYLTLSGLVVSIYVLDSIRSLATTTLNSTTLKAMKIYRRIDHDIQLSLRQRLFDELFELGSKAEEETQSTSAIVLNEFWQTLTSCGRIRIPESSENKIAFEFVDMCTRSNWMRIHRPTSSSECLLNWIIANQDLTYRGKTLRQWVEKHSGEDAYKARWKKYSRFKRIFSTSASNINFYQEKLLGAIAKAFDLGFIYAAGQESKVLGYVERWAREGDLICLTRNSDVPIVLRRDEGGYRFVCETVLIKPIGRTEAARKWQTVVIR